MTPTFWPSAVFRGSGFLILLAFSAAWVGGCAGGSLKKVGGDGKLPEELPKEFQEKFEIRDAQLGAPTAQDSLSDSGKMEPKNRSDKKKKSKTRRERGAKKVKESPEEPAFVFPNRRPEKDPIWMNEKLVYEITYFGMGAGDFTLEVLPYKVINNRKVYHVRGTAVTSKVFSLFYRLNDVVESFFDFEGFFSHRFHLVLDESKQTRDSLELHDSEKGQTFYWNRWNRPSTGYIETKDFFPMPPFCQDGISALYYLRVVPFPSEGVITVPVVSEGKTWDAEVSVVRREILNTPMGRVQTVVLKPETKYQGVLQKKGDSFLWLTDDERRIPVRLEAKVKVGSVVASLKEIENGTPPAEQ